MLSWLGIKTGTAPPAAPPGPTTFTESLQQSTSGAPPAGAAPGGSAAAGMGGGWIGGGGKGRSSEPPGGGDPQKAFHFDPSGLERAAKAARDLDASRHAQQAFETVLAHERTEQMRLEAQLKQYEASNKALDVERIQREQEERRKTLETETAHIQYRQQEQDKLARRRQEEQIAAQRALQDEQLRKQEESLRRQEELRQKTIDYEMRLKRDLELERVKAETEGKIHYERENRDLHLEQLRVQAAEARATTLEAIRVAGTTVGQGFSEFIEDRPKVLATLAGASLLALGVYGARTSTSVIGRIIEARVGKPSLIRETSRKPPFYPVRHPWQYAKQLYESFTKRPSPLQDMVLDTNLEQRLSTIAWTTINARRHQAPFRNILLYGPPGTGKTMFAKNMARNSGMDYAILTGGDVTPLGRSAVTEIHKLFDWANTSRRGLLLFVDEAEAFLRKRGESVMSEDMRNALNAFLYRTGETSQRFMVVLASNQPEQLDWAVNDRVDEMVGFHLPGQEERYRILKQYFDRYVLQSSSAGPARKITVTDMDDSAIREASERTVGFSGRELSKMIISMQAAAYATDNAVLNRARFDEVLNHFVDQHNQRQQWSGKPPHA